MAMLFHACVVVSIFFLLVPWYVSVASTAAWMVYHRICQRFYKLGRFVVARQTRCPDLMDDSNADHVIDDPATYGFSYHLSRRVEPDSMQPSATRRVCKNWTAHWKKQMDEIPDKIPTTSKRVRIADKANGQYYYESSDEVLGKRRAIKHIEDNARDWEKAAAAEEAADPNFNFLTKAELVELEKEVDAFTKAFDANNVRCLSADSASTEMAQFKATTECDKKESDAANACAAIYADSTVDKQQQQQQQPILSDEEDNLESKDQVEDVDDDSDENTGIIARVLSMPLRFVLGFFVQELEDDSEDNITPPISPFSSNEINSLLEAIFHANYESWVPYKLDGIMTDKEIPAPFVEAFGRWLEKNPPPSSHEATLNGQYTAKAAFAVRRMLGIYGKREEVISQSGKKYTRRPEMDAMWNFHYANNNTNNTATAPRKTRLTFSECTKPEDHPYKGELNVIDADAAVECWFDSDNNRVLREQELGGVPVREHWRMRMDVYCLSAQEDLERRQEDLECRQEPKICHQAPISRQDLDGMQEPKLCHQAPLTGTWDQVIRAAVIDPTEIISVTKSGWHEYPTHAFLAMGLGPFWSQWIWQRQLKAIGWKISITFQDSLWSSGWMDAGEYHSI